MRTGIIVASAFCALLAGCQKQEGTLVDEPNNPKSPGRFSGIGVFEAGRLWELMAVPSPPDAKKDPAAATLQDDEHVIVVVDTHTGEVRQCGDHSGFCVAMNPWTGTGPQNMLPAKMVKHEADLIAEQEAENKRQQQAEAKRQRK
jgi:hypothetical protein